MKTFIFLSFALLLVFCMLIFAFCMQDSYRRKYRKDLADDLNSKAVLLADQIALAEFDLSEGSLDTDMDQIANILKGRILVVDRSYHIVKDTYVFQQDSYLISSTVMDVMTGAKTENVRTKEDCVEVMVPVTAPDDTITGVVIMTASLESYQVFQSFMFHQILILLGILLVVGILAAALIAMLSMRDLARINRQISHISEGNLEAEVPVQGFRETRNLAKNYNAVLGRLNSMDSTRQEFVSNVSHELKTPITSMKVLAESVLQNEDATPEVYKEFMTDISAEIDRETKIINDLLVLVKTDKQSAKLNTAETDINELISIILKRVTPIANQRSIELIYESYREISAEVDEVKISLALSNLIENAIKYNVDNGWVKVSLNADHKYFYVKVADSGVGIPDDCKDLVFDRFYRVDKARSRDTGGTGLGLSIARNAILLHDGTVKLYSESGKGTTFTVKIPLRHTDIKQEEKP